MAELYKGWAEPKERRALLSFLDTVFTRVHLRPVQYFLRLLPKLYKKEYDPCAHNLVIHDGKHFRAAVGLYMLDLVCGEETLRVGGIGNVAVGKKFRGMGYMKELMALAQETAAQRGADLMVLGGLRQRYNYFGYERAGAVHVYSVTATNMRHVLGGGDAEGFSVHHVRPEDTALLDNIHALRKKAPVHVVTARAALYDTLVSWLATPYALLNNGRFAGYCLVHKLSGRVEELRLVDESQFASAVSALRQHYWRVKYFHVSPQETAANAFFETLCENVKPESPEAYLVLRWRHTLEVLLRQQHTQTSLVPGEVVIEIAGHIATENLRIAVTESGVSVTETDDTPSVTLPHLAATRAFFAPVSTERAALPPTAQAWLPLPLFLPNADMV
ncbi:MAG: GNAT family N-acetyltransferase [Oscillospiraceae bacterium]|jgi:predicted N-acetyltransferase YhbS|nr:GNAT family N-acetyltransferase [Oscillospiraceae bacterium]